MSLLDAVLKRSPAKGASGAAAKGPEDTPGLARLKKLQQDAFFVFTEIGSSAKPGDNAWLKDPRIQEAYSRVEAARTQLSPADQQRQREQFAFFAREMATRPTDDPEWKRMNAETLRLLDKGLLLAGVGRYIDIKTGEVSGPNKDLKPPAGGLGIGGMIGGAISGGWKK